MGRRGITRFEILVVVAVLATFVVVIAVGKPAGDQEPPVSWNLYTAQHDGHWFVKDAGGGVCHHPDCPCKSKRAESGE